MTDPGFAVLFDDAACLVVCKPPGVLTQAPPGIDSLELRVRDYLAWHEQRVHPVYLGVPHRLDRPASGAIVFAKTKRAARKLSKQFERRQVRKTYWAGVSGEVLPPLGTWQDYLYKLPGEPRAQVVAADHPEGRRAVLHYRTLAVRDAATWLEILLATGRTHQIRVQAASRGHPLLGDELYGAAGPFGPAYDDERLRPIALHARQLEFAHPDTREPLSIVAPAPIGWPDLTSRP